MNTFEYLANIFEAMKWLVGCISVVFSLCGVFKFVIFEFWTIFWASSKWNVAEKVLE